MPQPAWRLPTALTAALLVDPNSLVIRYGTVGHPYGLCLFLTVGAFRLAVSAVRLGHGWLSLFAGLCAGAAAAASFLAAPVAPILFLWMLRQKRTGNRLRKSAWFLRGAAIPFLLVLWLAVQGPRETLFSVVEYHLFFRTGPWNLYSREGPWIYLEGLWWDVRMLYGFWFTSTQGLVLIFLGAVRLTFLTMRNEWEASRRAEFALCGWLSGGLVVYLACTIPTHDAYLVLMMPFLSILASVGVYAIGTRVWATGRAGWVPVPFVGLFAFGLVKETHPWVKEPSRWQRVEDVAREVNRATPNQGLVWADTWILLAAQRMPPAGMENPFGPDLELLPALATSLTIVSPSHLNQWLAAGRFSTVAIEFDDQEVETLGLPRLYRRRTRAHEYDIFWNRVIPEPVSRSPGR